MRLFTITSASVLSFLFVASPLFAQPRWTAELRGGVNVAVDEFDAVELKTGAGVGGGLDVALSDRWSLTPGVRYRRFEPKVRFGGVESSATLSYVALDVGVAVKF